MVREVIFISFLPALVRGLRVDLGRREVLVAQELLDRPHTRALIEQVRRKAVAQRMRRGLLVQPGYLDVLVENLSNTPAGEPFSETIQEECIALFIRYGRVGLDPYLDVALDRQQGKAADRNQPCLLYTSPSPRDS